VGKPTLGIDGWAGCFKENQKEKQVGKRLEAHFVLLRTMFTREFFDQRGNRSQGEMPVFTQAKCNEALGSIDNPTMSVVYSALVRVSNHFFKL
jgi:hypothetical protein